MKKLDNCSACHWGEFQMTATGRVKRNVPGRCTYSPFPLPLLPISMPPPRWPPYTIGVWPDMGGAECSVYRGK